MENGMEKDILKKLLEQKKTIKQIAKIAGKAQSSVRYWMSKYGFKPTASRRTWEDDEMIKAINESDTISDVLRKLNLTVRPGNYDTVKRFVMKNGIDVSHILGKSSGYGGNKEKPLSEILVKDSTYSRKSLKKRLISEKILENKCCICGLKNKWNKKPIVMVLDHIDGDRFNNEIENLRFLCPNCNSQQVTFCRMKSYFEPKEPKKYYCKCGREKWNSSKKCSICSHKDLRRTEWPSKKKLIKLIQDNPMTRIGKMFGVSDNAVRKWAKHYGIDVKTVKNIS